jgi:hypothetical protein
MKSHFYHDPILGDEWYVIERSKDGMFKAVCTRGNDIYKLGEVDFFDFTDKEIFKRGKLKPNNHSLTLNKKNDGKPRNANW